MSIWIILLIAVNILMLAGLGVCYVRLQDKREDDPRLSYGLKLLQSKISVLEDLSDRTEVQVKQLLTLLEKKLHEVKARVEDADTKINHINQSMKKTLEVAEIFQAQIPHEEIVERQVSNKYIKAARLANQGKSIDEIQQQVDLPAGELDFIYKVNKDQLVFSEEHLPSWVDKHPLENKTELFEPPSVNMDSLEKLGREFKEACKSFADKHRPTQEDLEYNLSEPVSPVENKHEPEVSQTSAEKPSEKLTKQEKTVVPYQFKRGDVIYD